MSRITPSKIAIRAYTEKPDFKPVSNKAGKPYLDEPSPWTLTFDTETTTCPAQSLRVGCYQVRWKDELRDKGLFYDPDTLGQLDLIVLKQYAEGHQLKLITVDEFRRLLLKIGYKLNGLVIGFNLPFDISRIAIEHGEARGHMRGGYSFKLVPYTDQPAVRIKHLSARASLIDFAAPGKQLTPRGMRKRGSKVRHHRGFFSDLKTLAAALTSRSFSLETLSEFLQVGTRKQATEEHGGPLTFDYLDYACADVQATWECFVALRERYQQHGLVKPFHRILSEASIGKAYLEQMGIQPLLACQPDFPREMLGIIMCSYFGGRAEVRLRRETHQVLYCDFKSMYPTVNALMGLWDFVIADGMTWSDTTKDTQDFLDRIERDNFQSKATWKQLRTLVQLCPDEDVLPVRAKYNGKINTIGQNYLTSEQPLWYNLADVVASKILTGKTPRISRAITFEPGSPQPGLKPIDLFGDPAFRVDPRNEDVFNRLIDLRDKAKADRNQNQQAIKIVANATSYGIFIEVQRDDAPKPEPLMIYDHNGEALETKSKALEQPGKFFHPLLGTLITGAARLMLALSENLTLDAGLKWVFCDTDSLAIARPEGMAEAEFYERAQSVIDWFEPLNPYQKPGSILQIEDVNFDPETGQRIPLYAFAISAKRYALFNIDENGSPIIRKASAHGLGHLMPPYGEDDPAPGVLEPVIPLHEIGVSRWQYDLWFHIISAALRGEPDMVCLDYHPALQKPALSRYGATSPAMLRWMKAYNEGKPYHKQVKPFGFLVSLTARLGIWLKSSLGKLAEPHKRGAPKKFKPPKPIAPFERDSANAVEQAFDRETGRPVLAEELKTYEECLSSYHLSLEDKFENGEFFDRGETRRRRVIVETIELIGKEANNVGEVGEVDPKEATTLV